LETMKIPLAEPFASQDHLKAVKEVLESGQFVNGLQTKEFEKEFAKLVGCKNAIAVNSGTAALHLALLSAGIKRGDEVITVSHTFIATLESIWHVGGKPQVADIDDRYYTMDVTEARKLISDKTRAIIPVHIFGHPVDMDPLQELASEHNLVIIEDAAQAHGAQYKSRSVGTLGDIACFSFYPSKNLTVCGDGGMIVTQNDELAGRAKMLRDHGRKEKYASELVGYNYRISEIASAIGRVSLPNLSRWNEERRNIASRYEHALSGVGDLVLPKEADWARHVYHVYAIRHPHRDALAQWLSKNGIQTGKHYPVPCHLQPVFAKMEHKSVRLERTEAAANELLSLPMYPEMTGDEIDYVAGNVRKFIERPN